MAHGPSLLRVMELSALLVQSQKQNEEKEKTMKTLNDTVEILVCFTFIWEIAQCLFSSLSTKRCGFLKRKSGKDANCLGTSSGTLPGYLGKIPYIVPCVFGTCGVSPGAGSGSGAADNPGVFIRGVAPMLFCLGLNVSGGQSSLELTAS